jgi:hypothetical protein
VHVLPPVLHAKLLLAPTAQKRRLLLASLRTAVVLFITKILFATTVLVFLQKLCIAFIFWLSESFVTFWTNRNLWSKFLHMLTVVLKWLPVFFTVRFFAVLTVKNNKTQLSAQLMTAVFSLKKVKGSSSFVGQIS